MIHLTQKQFQEQEFPQALELQGLLKKAVKKNKADAILLSGGIDSALLAALDTSVSAITVVFEENSLDLAYAKKLTEFLGMPWYPLFLSRKEALEKIWEIMKFNQSYDLAVKGNIPVYAGLQLAKKNNFKTVRTGDGADELFAGYSGVHNKSDKELGEWMEITMKDFKPPSFFVSREFDIKTDYPYLYKEVVDFAFNLKREDLIYDFLDAGFGDVAQADIARLADLKSWGKIILRMAAKGILPDDIIWRPKTPLEYGSGFRFLEQYWTKKFKTEYKAQLEKEEKHFWNYAHAYLYLQYRSFGFTPPVPKKGEYACKWCAGGVIKNKLHCKTCGGYPVNVKPEKMFVN